MNSVCKTRRFFTQSPLARWQRVRWLAQAAACAVILLIPHIDARAGGSGANVAVIVNAESWASMTIANEYIALRKVPANNVVYLTDVPGFEVVDIETFRERVLRPALSALESRNLGTQIDYVVYSADFPYAVDLADDIGDAELPEVVTPVGSLTGLTYLCQSVLSENLSYLGFQSNHYFRPPDVPNAGATFGGSAEDARRITQAVNLMMESKYEEAEKILTALLEDNPDSMLIEYNLACCGAKLGNADEAMRRLKRAVDAGWWNVAHIENDPDMDSLRDRKDFQELYEKLKSHVIDVEDTRGFRTVYAWNEKFEQVAPNQGVRYLITSMLAPTAGRGVSVNQAIESLRRAHAADGTAPRGTIYFMNNDNVRARTRAWAFLSAVRLLAAEGVTAEVIKGEILPRNKDSVAGVMAGIDQFTLDNWGSSILPGAFAEHLTSSGGMLKQGSGQTPLSEWIAAGAAGTSGAVTEPYAVQWKFPSPYLHVHYARGATMGEAYYQSVQMPYQLLLVGDPLCAPWFQPPDFQITGINSHDTVKGRVTLKPQAAEDAPFKAFEIYLDGRGVGNVAMDKEFSFATAPLPDGHHQLQIVAVLEGDLESKSTRTIPFTTNNHGLSVKLRAANAQFSYGQSVRLHASAPGAREIVIVHNGRPVAGVEGAEGDVEIATHVLGMGKVPLVGVALFGEDGGQQAISQPTMIEINPQRPLPGIDAPRGDLTPGVRVTNATQRTTVIPSLRGGGWQRVARIGEREFEIETYLSAPSDDLYQIQLRSDSPVVMTINDSFLTGPEGIGGDGRWLYAPVNLKQGWHKLVIQVSRPGGKANEEFSGRIDIRFGGQGTQSPDGRYFRALADDDIK